MNKFDTYLKERAKLVEKNLAKYIAKIPNSPKILTDAMDYSLQAGGKRVRPVLLMATAEAFGKKAQDVLPAACAVEMLHTYSLIHDDLPCMDNDDLRRGKPTNHKVFGEDLALLAGDALLTYVFEVFAQNGKIKSIGAGNTLSALLNFAHCAGASGMVGGQTADVYAEGMGTQEAHSFRADKLRRSSKLLTKKTLHYFMLPPQVKETTPETILNYIHANKTGALIRGSVETGALLAGAKGSDLKYIQQYANCIGLVFQIVDDILDVTSSVKQLGKSNSDDKNGKLTFVSLYGLEGSRKHAQLLIAKAQKALGCLKNVRQKNLWPLYEMAEFFKTRTY
ncbi:MAG: polyprenyl synthetase family protein [Elusimicrobiaceae bacterium]|nr:polyprenyl synthetase family protein [Elusimicrobiaceae bacterium]